MNHNEICNKLDGVRPIQKTQMKRTKKMGKRGLGLLIVLIVSAVLVSAGIMTFYSARNKQMDVKKLITLDGLSDGLVHQEMVEMYGGDVIETTHVLKNNHPTKSVSVEEVDSVENITDDEIIIEYLTCASSPTSWNGGTSDLTRTIGTSTVVWTGDAEGAFLLTVLSETAPLYKIATADAIAWNYYVWTGTDWGTPYAMTEGTEYQGVTVAGTMLAFTITIQKATLGSGWYWGYYAYSTNPTNILTVPSAWVQDHGITNTFADGYTTPFLPQFPITMTAGQEITFLARYTADWYVEPDILYEAMLKITKA